MDKQAILNEIRRTASENGGTPLGRGKFLQETGIKEADWSGKFWIRRGDAVREAGFEPNQLQSAYGDEFLIKKFIELGREIGHFSVTTERQMKARIDDSFPSSENQISLQLPEDLELIHAIRTDDAYGIESYWHKRFAAKNTKGEWFSLSRQDIEIFKRRKFM